MATTYQNPRGTRREHRNIGGRFRGGKLAPVMATVVRESESGMLSQSLIAKLDPIAGQMITPITLELTAVAVPVQAIDALKNPEDDYAGNTEIVRDKLLSGVPLFGLEEESEISKRLGVVPRSISGQKMVNECVRLAHNAAVNYLRRRKYVNAAQVLANNTAITPALISQTVLERLNGVLDPEDRVEGSVQLDIGMMKLPVRSVEKGDIGSSRILPSADPRDFTPVRSGDDNTLSWEEQVYAEFDGATAGGVSLTDFYEAEIMDRLVRKMRQLVDDNPEYGEEIVQRWAHGLSVDTGKQPFILHQSRATFGQRYREAQDGPSLDVSQSEFVQEMRFTAPVPRTELGCIVVTFASVKPDETLASQPHPFLSEEWGAINYVSDEMARDPVPVKIRELDADCDEAEEGTTALYVGHNHMKMAYVNYGFNRHLDPTTVEAKTALWQLEVPMSVTPESVLYPEDLPHYPFKDQQAEICTYQLASTMTVSTPLVFGPTPVEELAIIETSDIFQDASDA